MCTLHHFTGHLVLTLITHPHSSSTCAWSETLAAVLTKVFWDMKPSRLYIRTDSSEHFYVVFRVRYHHYKEFKSCLEYVQFSPRGGLHFTMHYISQNFPNHNVKLMYVSWYRKCIYSYIHLLKTFWNTILGNCPTWRTNSFQCIYLFIVLYMFRACHARNM